MKIIYGKKYLLDTNIFLFAFDKNSPNHENAVTIFKLIEVNKFIAYTTIQNLLEYAAVLTRFYKIPAKKVSEDLEILFESKQITILYPIASMKRVFINLLKKYSAIYVFDLYLASYVMNYQLDGIITDDRDFEKIKTFSSFNPF